MCFAWYTASTLTNTAAFKAQGSSKDWKGEDLAPWEMKMTETGENNGTELRGKV